MAGAAPGICLPMAGWVLLILPRAVAWEEHARESRRVVTGTTAGVSDPQVPLILMPTCAGGRVGR